MSSFAATCNFEGAQWLLFGPNVAPLVYYSHLPVALFSFLLALYLFYKNKKALANRVLFFTILAFVIWVICDSIYWASNRSDIIMFVWAIDILVEPLVYIGSFYLLYVLINKNDLNFQQKLSLGILYLPIILLLPNQLTLSGFDLSTCLAVEGPVAMYYSYFIEIVIVVLTLSLCVKTYLKADSKILKQKILYLGTGTMCLLIAFSWGNIVGSFNDNWQLGQYGLFGMPVFISLLVYSIVKFKLFNIKIIGTTALVLMLWVATAALLAIQDIYLIRSVVGITLILTTLFGWILVDSVRKEVTQREIIQKQKDELERANEGQSNLIHIMNHQIKGYLSKSRNIFAELLSSDSDYGPVSESARPLLQTGLDSLTEGVGFVQQVLHGSAAESGRLVYSMAPIDFSEIVRDVSEHQRDSAVGKGLEYEIKIDEGNYRIQGDNIQLREAVRNLIDNSIQYTPTGSLHINLSQKDDTLLFEIKDTGVGLAPEDKPRLFTKGGRGKDSLRINVNSTGYGLAFVKAVVEAHKGTVGANSEGPGKGSTFFLTLPLKG